MEEKIQNSRGWIAIAILVVLVTVVSVFSGKRAMQQIETQIASRLETVPADVLSEALTNGEQIEENGKRLDAIVSLLERMDQRAFHNPGNEGVVGDITNTNQINLSGQPDTSRILSTQDVAELVGVNADTIRRRWDSGTLDDFEKLGENRWRFVPETGTKQARNEHELLTTGTSTENEVNR